MRTKFVSEVDYAARQALLLAIQKRWQPKPLAGLTKLAPDIVPWLSTSWEADVSKHETGRLFRQAQFNVQPCSIRWSTLAADDSTAGRKARLAIQSWQDTWSLRWKLNDPWILDAALHSVLWMRLTQADAVLKWAYSPPERVRPLFDFSVSTTRPVESEIVNRLRRELRAYLKARKARLYRDGNTERDAEWTARWVIGESDQRIYKTGKRARSEDAVRIARKRFAKRAGITLVDSPTVPDTLPARDEKRGKKA